MNNIKLTDEELAAIHKWQDEHECYYRTSSGCRYIGPIGGIDTFHFVPSSIGTIGTVTCACGSKFVFRKLF